MHTKLIICYSTTHSHWKKVCYIIVIVIINTGPLNISVPLIWIIHVKVNELYMSRLPRHSEDLWYQYINMLNFGISIYWPNKGNPLNHSDISSSSNTASCVLLHCYHVFQPLHCDIKGKTNKMTSVYISNTKWAIFSQQNINIDIWQVSWNA